MTTTMAKHPLWNDEYRILLLAIYLQKPVGVKSPHSRQLVELALQLHVPPKTLHKEMQMLDDKDKVSVRKLWDTYGNNPRRLNKAVKRLRGMDGFGNADVFYDGVDNNDTLAEEYMPVCAESCLSRAMIAVITSLYFRLTPTTMVTETPEVIDTAKLLGIKPETVESVLHMLQQFDPLTKRERTAALPQPVADTAHTIWRMFNNMMPEAMEKKVEQYMEFFK